MDNPADGPGSVPQVKELEGCAEVGPMSMREEPAKVPEVSANVPEVSTNAPEKSMNVPEDSATTLKDLDKRFGHGWAKGTRLIFLQSHLEQYKTACNESRSKGHDVMDSIHNAYFKQFDWRQPVTEEPEEGAPPPNPLEPLSPEERKLKGAVVDRLKQSIASWLNYRTNRVDTGLSHLTNKSTNDPFAILLSKLSGVGLKPPKRRAAWEHYAKEASDKLKANFEQEFQQSGKPGTQHANARNKFMHDSFDALEPDQKERWAADAKEWHRVQVQATNARDSLIRNMTPSQWQDCLNHLGDLFYPIIDGVNELLDMHVSVLVGGPEPAKGGRLNVISLHSGVNLDAIPQNWGDADKEKYKLVTRSFQEYLATSYMREQQLKAAMPNTAPAPGASPFVADDANDDDDDDDDDEFSKHTQRKDSRAVKDHARPPSKVYKTQKKHKVKPTSKRGRRSNKKVDTETEATSATETESSSDKEPPPTKRKAHTSNKRKKHHHDTSDDSDSESESDSPSPKRRQPSKLASIRDRSIKDRAPTAGTYRVGPPKKAKASMKPASKNKKVAVPSSKGCKASAQEMIPTVPNTPSSTQSGMPLPGTSFSPAQSQALLDEVTTRLSAEPPSVKRPVDDSWPLWFKNQYKVLYKVKSMPDVWFVLLAKFDLFEEMTAYNNTGNGLATLNRPEEISWWIRAGRKANPTLSDVDKFGDNWWRWWISLQPEWRGVASEESALERRHRQADKAVSCAAAAWEELDKPGRNGFLSPIAALFWWASARIDSLKKPVVTEESSEDQALESELTEEHENLPECEDWTLEFEDGHDWLMAVADMTWVMDCMMISHKATM
ncbi:hypothetical protein BDN71DRAFT_1594671 [Pleurotus eryngii]|uniref:Uncharacterized protein n=1 Tax=Pleurotus eryngii TaxID=5323 RepID=A0A9P5ZGG9_PLEER|nr:hypothetical protein BDN71DRAFT_1594671 [Pleurotus eryngii]